MRTEKSVTKHPEKVLPKIICNACGKAAKHPDCTDITPVDIEFSYGSEQDGQTWSFDICDTCIKDVVSKFKVPPTKEAT